MKRAALLALCAVLGWMVGGWLFAAEPPATLDALDKAAREACEAQGHTLRALLIAYDEKAQPVAARAACGEPRRSNT